ncbi:hypothetical protein CSIRO_3063 [Bradyrhizobiaceae bacterium SG-6C]|nr:hypothetical protein CSIRO_3063 [Bradyrhizobiaceae bacterium SG-6C]
MPDRFAREPFTLSIRTNGDIQGVPFRLPANAYPGNRFTILHQDVVFGRL